VSIGSSTGTGPEHDARRSAATAVAPRRTCMPMKTEFFMISSRPRAEPFTPHGRARSQSPKIRFLLALFCLACRAGQSSAHLERGPADGNAADFWHGRDLPARNREAWESYLEQSERLGAADRASMESELQSLGRREMTQAPYRKAFRL